MGKEKRVKGDRLYEIARLKASNCAKASENTSTRR